MAAESWLVFLAFLSVLLLQAVCVFSVVLFMLARTLLVAGKYVFSSLGARVYAHYEKKAVEKVPRGREAGLSACYLPGAECQQALVCLVMYDLMIGRDIRGSRHAVQVWFGRQLSELRKVREDSWVAMSVGQSVAEWLHRVGVETVNVKGELIKREEINHGYMLTDIEACEGLRVERVGRGTVKRLWGVFCVCLVCVVLTSQLRGCAPRGAGEHCQLCKCSQNQAILA